MSKQHGAREQKRLAKQKAKRAAQRKQLARRNSPNPAIRLKEADHWPVVACCVPEELWEVGIGSLLLARRAPDGQLACAVFLVDVFCLGVKDAMWVVIEPGQLESFRARVLRHGRHTDVAPEYFAKLVYRAVDYAQALGFAPHSDFQLVQRLLAGIDPALCREEFEFGRDGQPLYVSGPFESSDRARIIAERVHAQGGHYLVRMQDSKIDPQSIADLQQPSDAVEQPPASESPPRRRFRLPWL